MSNNSNDEYAKEMSATRKALAICLRRLSVVEEKVDNFTAEERQRWEDEKRRRRERAWS